MNVPEALYLPTVALKVPEFEKDNDQQQIHGHVSLSVKKIKKKRKEHLFGLWTIVWDNCGEKKKRVKISYHQAKPLGFSICGDERRPRLFTTAAAHHDESKAYTQI